MEISSVLLRPPPVNPDYTPTPRPIRFPQSRHYQQYFQTEQSPTETLDDRIIRNPGTVPSSTTAEVSLPPTDSAPPCKYRQFINFIRSLFIFWLGKTQLLGIVKFGSRISVFSRWFHCSLIRSVSLSE